MFCLILILSVIAMIICVIISCLTEPDYGDFSVHGLFFVFAWISGIVALVMVIAICHITPKIATASTLDEKIAMYQEENATIEQDIDRIVEEYLKYEHDTFLDLKTEENSITLVTLFPELKSDKLVQQQLEIYVANNAKIRSLKEKKIDITKLKWLLNFEKQLNRKTLYRQKR